LSGFHRGFHHPARPWELLSQYESGNGMYAHQRQETRPVVADRGAYS